MEYEEYSYSSKNGVDEMLNSSNIEKVIKAIIGMVNGIEDWEWVEEKLLILIDNSDFWIAKNAITGFGDLARIHGVLNLEKVRKKLDSITNEDLKETIRNTYEDIEIFIK